MGLAEPSDFNERIIQATVSYALEASGVKATKAEGDCRVEAMKTVQNQN